MDEAREARHSGCAAVVVVLILVLVLAYAGGYVYYRSRYVSVTDRNVIVWAVALGTPARKAASYLYYPAVWIEARVRGGELYFGLSLDIITG